MMIKEQIIIFSHLFKEGKDMKENENNEKGGKNTFISFFFKFHQNDLFAQCRTNVFNDLV